MSNILPLRFEVCHQNLHLPAYNMFYPMPFFIATIFPHMGLKCHDDGDDDVYG